MPVTTDALNAAIIRSPEKRIEYHFTLRCERLGRWGSSRGLKEIKSMYVGGTYTNSNTPTAKISSRPRAHCRRREESAAGCAVGILTRDDTARSAPETMGR